MQGLGLLQATRLSRIIRELQDVRDMPKNLLFLNRTRVVPAEDGEIMGKFIGRAHIADLIADDQKAVAYQMGRISMEVNAPPNIKVGNNLTQEQINRLAAISSNPTVRGEDMDLFTNWENSTVDWLLLGVRQRMESLCVARAIDAFNYDRFGIKLSGVTWGMPSDLKVTPAIAWTDAANATPIDNILSVVLTATARYGITYNRITMSTASFRLMVATTEFQAKAKLLIPPQLGGSYSSFSLYNLGQQRSIAEAILGMMIEVYDARFWTHAEDGTIFSSPFLPINKVVLSSSDNDNDGTVEDFAMSVPTEARVASLAPNIVGDFGKLTRGPIAYATVPPDLNPPNVTYWAAARGFPRKFVRFSTAVLSVGTFTDPIPTGEPF